MDIRFEISPPVDNTRLNALFTSAWANHTPRDFQPVLAHSLLYVCAFDGTLITGFVNVAWDGGIHAFLLDTTVHRAYQHRGIGVRLVKTAVQAAREAGIEWLHVDYESHLAEFYRRCGFGHTDAGLLNLRAET